MKQRKAAHPGNCDIEPFLEGIHKIALSMIKHLPPSMHVDDLVSYGVIGLCDAWSRFEPSRGIRFWTYAEPRVWGAMGDGIRQWHLVHHRNKSGIRIVSDCALERESEPSGDIIREKSEMESLIAFVWSLVDTLPFDQRQVLELEFKHGLPIGAIPEVVGYSKSQVFNVRKKALTELRQALSDKTDESSSCSGRELAPAIFGEKG